MCEIFVSADPDLYQRHTHSLRLHAAVTSICLEKMFWQVLEEIARRDGLSLNQLLTRLHDEIMEARGRVENFASFLRVCCLRYLSLQVDGGIPSDMNIPLRSLDARDVLRQERNKRPQAHPAPS